jgi:hypothetical protein
MLAFELIAALDEEVFCVLVVSQEQQVPFSDPTAWKIQ